MSIKTKCLAKPLIRSISRATIRAILVTAGLTIEFAGSQRVQAAPTLVVTPASISVSPGQTQRFNAGGSSVTWSINPEVGTIGVHGLYTAPSSIASSQTITVTATSVAHPSEFGTATVTVTPKVALSLTPPSATLLPSQFQKFTASIAGSSNSAVTWSFTPPSASLISNGTTATYIAPTTVATTQNGTITATSVADPTKAATAVITLLQAIAVSVIPSSVSLTSSAQQQFAATVSGTSNTAVTWSINPPVGTISSAGIYKAPSTISVPQAVIVTAQSVADSAQSATAAVSLQTASVNVKSFGATGNGVTNDKPAFDAAFAALRSAGGGELYIPTGTYFYDSLTGNTGNQVFTDYDSNITVYGDGPSASVINFTGPGLLMGIALMDINRYCTSPPSGGCSPPNHKLPSYFLFNATSSGSSVTLTNPAQASNFIPGMVVFLESGDASPGTGHPPAHFEFNTVVSANAATGVIELQNALSDSYDTSNPNYPPMIGIPAPSAGGEIPAGVVPTNITIKNLGFTSTGANFAFLSTEGTINATIDNCSFVANGGTSAYFGLWNGFSWHATVSNSTFSGVSGDLGDAGAYFQFTNNVFQPSQSGISGSGSGREWSFQGNQISGPAFNLGGSTTYSMTGLDISNNSIQLQSSVTYPNGIALFNATGTSISNNTCSGTTELGNGGACIVLRSGSANSLVSGNTVNSPGLAYGVLLQSGASGATISQNQFISTGTGISILPQAVNTTVECNTFVSNTTNVANLGSGTNDTCLNGVARILVKSPDYKR